MNQVVETENTLIPIGSIQHPLALFCEGGLDDLLEAVADALAISPDATDDVWAPVVTALDQVLPRTAEEARGLA